MGLINVTKKNEKNEEVKSYFHEYIGPEQQAQQQNGLFIFHLFWIKKMRERRVVCSFLNCHDTLYIPRTLAN